ncbi:FUSC family membrane protein [Soonwooa sp.]|uniref:FUSC family protein n=1 Tax=Soonwooa sp. TaxID=1938592 RepID=UPI00260E5ECB|nr:FUSC family membrane protein [Soonwooa sp.]
MNYTSELKKFLTSQYIFAGTRIALAIVIPSIILAHFGLLQEYFLFPMGTSFVGLTDQPGPFIRRRNTLAFAVVSYFLVALIASLVKDFQIVVYLEIILFGMFFSLIGVYGTRLAGVGSLSLVVLSIFIDGHLTGHDVVKSLGIFLAGCVWFVIVFLVVSTLQPYKLASQMVGENYLELADYLRIKAKFYKKNENVDELLNQLISQQIKIKDQQEATREIVFKTRRIVNESTTQSRILMLMFLNSVDLYEKLFTSENDYRKLNHVFGETKILNMMHDYLINMANELTNIGIALQGNIRTKEQYNFDKELKKIYHQFYEHRAVVINSENLEDFMLLRQVLMRVTDVTDEVKTIFRVFDQDVKLAKSLSTGLDLNKFVPKEERLNRKVLFSNISLESGHFRHAVRVTLALFIGYLFSKMAFLGIGHAYWIMITITAILKPAYSTTKHRNLLRLYGTIAGGIMAYVILYFVTDSTVLLATLLLAMTLCFSLLKSKYFWAVFFMTIYVFLSFNFLKPGNVNLIFKDRIIDTAIGGAVTFLVAYFVFPVWEHTQNLQLMKKSAKSNLEYFRIVMDLFINKQENDEQYRLKRKNAIIDLANLSDNFQRMISDPKDQQKKLETVHQFVTTSHLLTAYTASLSQFAKNEDQYPEIDSQSWKIKISSELIRSNSLLHKEEFDHDIIDQSKIEPDDHVDELLEKRRQELDESEYRDHRDPTKISHLTELKSIHDLLELIYDVAKDQRKVVENYYKNKTE